MQASQKFVNLAYYCRYPTKQLSPFNIYSTTFLLKLPSVACLSYFQSTLFSFQGASLPVSPFVETRFKHSNSLNAWIRSQWIFSWKDDPLWKFSLPSFSCKRKKVVGQSGLEPPTSRLSVVCSSQLSYWPVLVEVTGLEPVTPCLQSRCSTSWAKPPDNVCPLN